MRLSPFFAAVAIVAVTGAAPALARPSASMLRAQTAQASPTGPITVLDPDTSAPVTLPGIVPSNIFTLDAAHTDVVKTGRTDVELTVPGPGSLTVLATVGASGVGARALLPGRNRVVFDTTKTRAMAAGSMGFTLLPKGAARETLMRHQRRGQTLEIHVTVTYTPVGGPPRTTSTYIDVRPRRR